MNQETKITGIPLLDESEAAKLPNKARRLFLLLIVPLLLLAGGAWLWWSGQGKVETDNAQVKQDITSVGAQVSGPIAEVFVKEGQQVRPGQLLFRIDPAPYRVALLQAEAQLAQAQLAERQGVTKAAGTGADIVGAEGQLQIAERALDRQAELLRQGFTTRVNYDAALAQVTAARTRLAGAQAEAANARAAIAPAGDQPGEQAARAAIAQARLNLSRGRGRQCRPSVAGPAGGTRHRAAQPGRLHRQLDRSQFQGKGPGAHGARPARPDRDRRLSRA